MVKSAVESEGEYKSMAEELRRQNENMNNSIDKLKDQV